jgi:hypothetical protein
MNTVALDPAYRRISVEEFLAMDFGDAKAELEDGLIYMMAGGNEAHARIAGNSLPSSDRSFAVRVPLLRFRPGGADR